MKKQTLQYDASVLIASAIGAEPFRCWRNAALTVLAFPDLFAFGTYIEGWIIIPRMQTIAVMEHGWCLAPDLGIIDPTIVLLEPQVSAVEYFPGFERAGQGFAQQVESKVVPLVCNSQYGQDGMEHTGYRQSYEVAHKRAHALARERQLSPTAVTIHRRSTQRGATFIGYR